MSLATLVYPYQEQGLRAFDDVAQINTDVATRRLLRWGRSSVSPHHLGTECEPLLLSGGGVAGFVRKGSWAIFPCEPATPPGSEDQALAEVLDIVRSRRLRPLFAAVTDVGPFERRGMATTLNARDAVIDVRTFTLAGSRRANIRHSVTSARRAGLTVRPWDGEIDAGIHEISNSWLATKRGGEMGFTLGRLADWRPEHGQGLLALDGSGRPVAVTTWRSYDNGNGRVIDIMRRVPDAPNPAMDLLIAESLLLFSAQSVEQASLAGVPVSHGKMAERVYPTESLRRYKDKFDPDWHDVFMVTQSRIDTPGALRALVSAFCPRGLLGAFRSNRHAA